MNYIIGLVIVFLIVMVAYLSDKIKRFHKYYGQRLDFFHLRIDDFSKQINVHKKQIDTYGKNIKTLSKSKDAILTKQNDINRSVGTLQIWLSTLDESVKGILKDIERLKSPRKFEINDIVKFDFDSKRLTGGKIANCREQTDGIFYSIIHKNKRYRDIPETSITK